MQQHHPFILTLQHLHFERQQISLWENISCEARPSDLIEVRGENGSGKSTLLRVIAGLLEPHAGNILWQNKSIAKDRENYQRQIHYLGHLNAVKMNLTVEENIRLNASLLSQKISQDELYDIVQRVGLRMHQFAFANTLSAGQLRRLSLAKLLIVNRPLWILDEPTTSLDSHAQWLVENLLEEHRKSGGAAFIATHHSFTQTASKALQLGECYA